MSAAPKSQMSAREQHVRRIGKILFCLDLKAAHTVCEDWTREERLANITPHFEDLWGSPPRIELIEEWLDSDELYHSPEVMNLEGFDSWLSSLSYEQLIAAATNTKAYLYDVRLVKGRIWKFQEQKMMKGLAERDLRHAFEINLGLLVRYKSSNENDYIKRLTEKGFMAKVRLERTLSEAQMLCDEVTKAFQGQALDEFLLPSLRLRAGALQEHYKEACELIEEKKSRQLVDGPSKEWL